LRTLLPFARLRAYRYAPIMDLPVRTKLPHTIPQWVAEGSWFFITINCVPPGKNQLCLTRAAHGVTRPAASDAVLDAMKFNHERFVWHCRLCLLMPDHLHAIMAFPREPGMATTIKNWKKFVAGKHGVDWQRDFFDHRLRDHHERKRNQLHPDESGPQRFVRATGGLSVGFPSERSPAAAMVGRVTPCAPP